MKKTFLLFAAMFCMMVAKAQHFEDANGIKYNVTSTENKTVEVSPKGRPFFDVYEGDIVIPATVTNDGVTYNVTGIGELAFYGCTSLTITLPSGVTSIGDGAFSECSSLASITLPSGVTSIGNEAFYNCSSLASVNLPNGVTSIGNDTFCNCGSLASVNLPNGVTSIGNHAFAGCSSLTAIILPDKLESLGRLSFQLCKSLAYVIFQGTTPPTMPNDTFYYPFDESGADVEGGSTKLFVPNDDAVTAYTTAGYTNVYAIPLDQLKSQALDEIATAMKGVTLTQDDAAIVSAYKESINQATDIVTIFQEWDNALSVINLQKAKDAAIAVIDDALDSYADITKEEKETIEEYRSKISNATSVSQVNAVKKDAMEIVLSILKIMAKGDLSWCYAEVLSESDLMPYFEEIDNATTKAGIDEIVKGAKSELNEKLKKGLRDTPHFVIGEKWYLAEPKVSYEYNHMADYTGGDISFPDGVLYESNSISLILNGGVEYTRTLPEGVWQCWYVPLSVVVDTERFDAAEVAGILTNAQGETVVAFNKLENGSVMHPNTIYVIRAKKGYGTLEIIPDNISLYLSKENQLDLRSAYDDFVLTGNYSPKEHGDWYTLDGTGKFSKMSSGSLKPQRFYLTITPREDGHYAPDHYNAKEFIDMMVFGDEEDVTGIESLAPTLSEGKGVIYDLMGRKVTSIQKGQIYIKDGKKYVAK